MASARALEKTKAPGVFKRGNRYVVVYRDPSGRQRKKFAETLAEAKDVKAAMRTDVRRGEWRALSTVTFAEYAHEWIESYVGRTSRGIRRATRDDYRARLEQDAIPFFGRMRLAEIEPRDLKAFAAQVGRRGVAANTVRLAVAPVKALFATAVEDGLIRSNPAAGLRLGVTTARPDDDADVDVKALADDELERLLDRLPAEWRLFFAFLAHTGVRIGEAIELRWGDVDLGARIVQVRRRFYRGTVDQPKSKYGRRRIRIPSTLARGLWDLRKVTRAGDDELVFTAETGGRIDQSNLMSRVLKPAAVAAGLGESVPDGRGGLRADSWVGFHTFRHTCATGLFRRGWNAVQVQRFLGHHRPSFTIDTYVHLLEGDLPDPDVDPREAPAWGNAGATRAPETAGEEEETVAAGSAI